MAMAIAGDWLARERIRGMEIAPFFGDDSAGRSAGRPGASVPVQRLVLVLMVGNVDQADRPAVPGRDAADAEQLAGVVHDRAARARDLGRDPLGALPVQRLIQYRLALRRGAVIADGPAVGRGRAVDGHGHVFSVRASAVRIRHRYGLPLLAVPVHRLVQEDGVADAAATVAPYRPAV